MYTLGVGEFSLLTRATIISLLAIWLWHTPKATWSKNRLSPLDWLMMCFFLLAMVGYANGQGRPDYFFVLAVLPYIVGRCTETRYSENIIKLHVLLGLMVAVFFGIFISDLMFEWERVIQHPVLFGAVQTAGGLDVILGYFPIGIIGWSLIKQGVFNRKRFAIALAVLTLTVMELVLMGTKAVVVSLFMAIIFFCWSKRIATAKNIAMLLAFLLGTALALVMAPKNELTFYQLTSPTNWIAVLHESEIGHFSNETRAAETHNNPNAHHNPNETDSGVARIKLSQLAIAVIFDSPWQGIGAQNWTYWKPHPHNIILESGVMFGAPAALVMSIFFISLIYKASKKDDEVLILLTAFVVFLLVYNLLQGQLASFRSLPLFLMSGFVIRRLVL